MTPEQCRLAAEHTELVLSRVRSSRWHSWSEAESSALEILCAMACSFDGQGPFAAYLSTHLDRRLIDHFRQWTRRRVHSPVITEFVELQDVLTADDGRGPDELAVAADTARRELGSASPTTVWCARMIDAGMLKHEIATHLGVTPARVSQHLEQGRRRIEEYRAMTGAQ